MSVPAEQLLLYPDNAILSYWGAPGPEGNAQGLLKLVEDSQAKVCISLTLILEVYKNPNHATREAVLRFIQRLESDHKIQWMASVERVWDHELLNLDGTLLIPQADVAYVGNAASIATAADSTRLMDDGSQDLDTFLRDVLAKHLAEFNAIYDSKTASLHADWRNQEDGCFVNTFFEYVAEHVQGRAERLHALPKRLVGKGDDFLRQHLPSLWMFRAARRAMLRESKKGEFKKSDLRDMLHIPYVPYVDLLCVDHTNFNMLHRSGDLTEEWKAKLVSNKHSKPDDWTVAAHHQRALAAKKGRAKPKRPRNDGPTDSPA